MEIEKNEIFRAYEFRKQWPPYTYREYPPITPEMMNSFIEFLKTENTRNYPLELQPWITFCDSKCAFCYYPSTIFKEDIVTPYLTALKKN